MLIDQILDLIFIPNGRCPICYRVIFFSDRFICHECENKLEIILGKKCKNCGKEIREDINYCSDCITHNYHYEKGFSLYNYEGSMKTIIHKIKFSNCPELGEFMGNHLGESLKNCTWFKDVELMIPVPLHENRLKFRGYNQSESISWGILAYFSECNSQIEIKLKNQLLIRKKDTAHQLELNKDERFKNVKNAFQVISKEQIKDRVILLIDDVYTTGATIEGCSAELMKNGAKKVYFAVLASGRTRKV